MKKKEKKWKKLSKEQREREVKEETTKEKGIERKRSSYRKREGII